MNKAAKQFWSIVQGSLIVFTLLVVAYALNSLGALRSVTGYYSWLPNTQSAFNEFLKQLGIIGVVGSLLDIIALTARWIRYLFQRPFFS
jgi:uncharacterized membrane protein